jgi:primosomal protein N' (replication factor Y)
MYIIELLLKLSKDTKTTTYAKMLILQQMAILKNDRQFRSVIIQPDVDPQ